MEADRFLDSDWMRVGLLNVFMENLTIASELAGLYMVSS